MLPDQKLNALVTRHAALERDLAAVQPPETYVKLSREFAELSPVVEAVNSYRAAQRELADVTSLIDDPATDAEMRSVADAERRQLEARRTALEEELRRALIPKDAMDERNSRRDRRRRSRAVRRQLVPHVRALRRAPGLEGGSDERERRRDGRI
jgi:peptide chain release factor 1